MGYVKQAKATFDISAIPIDLPTQFVVAYQAESAITTAASCRLLNVRSPRRRMSGPSQAEQFGGGRGRRGSTLKLTCFEALPLLDQGVCAAFLQLGEGCGR